MNISQHYKSKNPKKVNIYAVLYTCCIITHIFCKLELII
jgi:hypothetical protein